MQLKYVKETIGRGGQVETIAENLSADEIRIGRASGCHILLRGRTVSLNHARLILEGENLVLEDLNSLSGIRVNSKIVKRSVLSEGDVFQIASSEFRVEKYDGEWLVRESRREENSNDDERVEKIFKLLQFQTHLPSYALLSSFFIFLVVVLYIFLPVFGANKGSLSSGPLATAHKTFSNDCNVCHAKAFEPVRDQECLACHKLSDHADNIDSLFKSHSELNLRCASCHMEHNGNKGLIAREPKLCLNCHANTKDLLPDSDVLQVASYLEHPEFRIASDSVGKVSLASPDAKDLSTVKLNHALHLKDDLLGPDGPTQLNCMSCHEFSEDQRNIVPVNFENHCQSCHSLGFDDRLPDSSVPHAKPDVVYNYLLGEYAKEFLQEGETEPPILGFRRKPGNKVERKEIKREYEKENVIASAREAEKQLFNNTACVLCHSISQVDHPRSHLSAYEVEEPSVVARWFSGAIFDHGAHQAMKCSSCHGAAEKSEKTSDILVPGVDNCMSCHREAHESDYVPSDCVTCHSYHDSRVFDFSKKGENWFSDSLAAEE